MVEGALEERGGVFTASLINGPSPGESDGLQLCDRGLGPINACPRVAATAVGKHESSSEECEKERRSQCGSHRQGSFENIPTFFFFFYLPTNPSVPSVLGAKGSCFLTRGEGRDSRPAEKEGWWGGGRQWRGPHPPPTLTSPLRFPHTARRWRSGAPTVNSHPGSQRSCQSSQCVRGLSGRHYTHHFRPSISSVLHLPLPSLKPLHHVQLSTEPPVICIHPVLLRSDQEIGRHYHKSLSGQLLNCKFFFSFFLSSK